MRCYLRETSCGIINIEHCFSVEWNLIRLYGSTYGIVTKIVHKTIPECGGGQWSGVGQLGGRALEGGGVVVVTKKTHFLWHNYINRNV